MKNDGDRLDVPGFSYGQKTGEFIDVPRIYGGRPESRKSGKPHSLSELMVGRVVSRARKGLQRATQIAREEYHKRKRVRVRKLKAPITNHSPVKACNRRFFDHMGMRGQFLPYVEKPELIISGAKIAYEITDGFCPIVTTTSAREAQIIAATLAHYGIATEILMLAITVY